MYVTPGRHPFEVAPLLACALVGGVMVVADLRPPSLLAGYAHGLLTAWLAMIALGGVVGLVGVYWRGALDEALLIEFVGVGFVAAACLLYTAAMYVTQPISAAFTAAGLLTGLGVGAAWRAVQCLRDCQRVRRGVMLRPHTDLPLLTDADDPGPDGAEGRP